MANQTATPARISRSVREDVTVEASDPSVLLAFPNAEDRRADAAPSFFTNRQHAQKFLDERFAVQRLVRYSETVELATVLRVDQELKISPNLPLIRLIDETDGFDEVLRIAGYSNDDASGTYALELRS